MQDPSLRPVFSPALRLSEYIRAKSGAARVGRSRRRRRSQRLESIIRLYSLLIVPLNDAAWRFRSRHDTRYDVKKKDLPRKLAARSLPRGIRMRTRCDCQKLRLRRRKESLDSYSSQRELLFDLTTDKFQTAQAAERPMRRPFPETDGSRWKRGDAQKKGVEQGMMKDEGGQTHEAAMSITAWEIGRNRLSRIIEMMMKYEDRGADSFLHAARVRDVESHGGGGGEKKMTEPSRRDRSYSRPLLHRATNEERTFNWVRLRTCRICWLGACTFQPPRVYVCARVCMCVTRLRASRHFDT